MKQGKANISGRSRRSPRSRARHTWMPVTDSWIGSFDERLWNRSEDMSFDWASTDPWTHRIQFS